MDNQASAVRQLELSPHFPSDVKMRGTIDISAMHTN
jgi:hypothetical protein